MKHNYKFSVGQVITNSNGALIKIIRRLGNYSTPHYVIKMWGEKEHSIDESQISDYEVTSALYATENDKVQKMNDELKDERYYFLNKYAVLYIENREVISNTLCYHIKHCYTDGTFTPKCVSDEELCKMFAYEKIIDFIHLKNYSTFEEAVGKIREKTADDNKTKEVTKDNKVSSSDRKIQMKNIIDKIKAKCSILTSLCTFFSEKALNDELAPCFGREEEMDTINYMLYRRTKPNVMLLGKAGVGKTAIVEGLAQKMNESYENGTTEQYTVIAELSLNALVSGTMYRGTFEEKTEKLLAELASINYAKLVLFIDEIHSMNDIGSSDGSTSIGQILKPALARGDINVIGATTNAEYEKFLKPDGALCRRFNTIDVKEFVSDKARTIVRNILDDYGKYFKQDVSQIEIENIYDRYGTQLTGTFPDNFINIIDETLAIAKFKNTTVTTENFEDIAKKNCRKTEKRIGFANNLSLSKG